MWRARHEFLLKSLQWKPRYSQVGSIFSKGNDLNYRVQQILGYILLRKRKHAYFVEFAMQNIKLAFKNTGLAMF
jgi:hypothetical protein